MKRFFKNISEITFGRWSLALFFIAVISGIILIIPYDVNAPYKSISEILVLKPYASLVRNIHYWSSQIFLLALFIHLFEYFRKKEPVRLNGSIWFRLTLGLIVIFLVMFTGFLLKGDADALQARQIFDNLAKEIPLVGNLVSFFVLGNEGNFQFIYINHVATFTIIIVYIIFEHSRKIRPGYKEFVLSSIVVLIAALLVSAPLHDGFSDSVKGPWYFVGLQDLLHWFSHPAWVLVILAVILLLVYLAGDKRVEIWFPARRILLLVTLVYFILTVDGLFFRGAAWKIVLPWDKDYAYEVLGESKVSGVCFSADTVTEKTGITANGRVEGCMVCHNGVKGFTHSHNPQATGCFSCHGGNPFTFDKNNAHKGMVLFPGNLSNAGRSCGTSQCHPSITGRIHSNIMNSLTGMINVDRYVFNEQSSPDGNATVKDIHHTAADEHLRNLCVRCHLGNDKTEPGPVTEKSRGGGCLACHLNYSEKALALLKNNPGENGNIKFHPSVDLNVNDNHCFGCHSRSGRISANYEGWHETTLTPEEIKEKDGYRLVEGSRVFTYVKDDVHHSLGLECVDCHTSYELMGDGNYYRHEELQQDVSCSDCHTKSPDTVSFADLDDESAIVASLRFGNVSDRKFIRISKHKRPLINVFVKKDTVFLEGKNSRKIYNVKPPSTICERDNVHKDVSCTACHTSWAPTCIGCHNAYDPSEPAYDMIARKEKTGGWVEYVGDNYALPPTLAVRKTGLKKEIIPAVPGMILSIDISSFDKKLHDSLIFHRLYAPVSPHTIAKKGRNCKSCHNNPLALGYGSGKLDYIVKNGRGYWKFTPLFSKNSNDGLPEDAWIPFLGERKGKVSTRSDVFPLSVTRQKRMLTVGACLTCHDENSEIMINALYDFNKTFNNRSERCVVPF